MLILSNLRENHMSNMAKMNEFIAKVDWKSVTVLPS